MKIKSLLTACCLALGLSACQGNVEGQNTASVQLSPANDSAVELLAKTLQIKYQQVDNRPSAQCDPDIENGHCFKANLHLTANSAINEIGRAHV